MDMIPLCVPEIKGNEWNYIKECLDTNWVSSVGSYVDLFEKKFMEYCKVKSTVVTVNGTLAITLALQALGIGSGDEVIVPSMTFVASVNPIIYVGAEPVFADITDDTWVIDVNRIEELITTRTKAIIPVHIYGNMVDMEPLMKIAEKHGLFVIEDATEAMGSEYRDSSGEWYKAGTIGDYGAFSFNGNKLITTGSGGMLVTNNEQWGKRIKFLSNQAKTLLNNGGMIHEEIGYNYRMPNILAAMGVAQLEQIEEYKEKKLKVAELYNGRLGKIRGIEIPAHRPNVKNDFWLYSVVVSDEYPLTRDALIEKLNKHGIVSRPFFEPIHNMRPYLTYRRGDMSATERVSSRGINLPSSVGIKTTDIDYICGKIEV